MAAERFEAVVEKSVRFTEKESISQKEAAERISSMLDVFQKRVSGLPNLSEDRKKALVEDVRIFLFDSVSNSLRADVPATGTGTENALGRFNAEYHDTNREVWLDRFEFERYARTMRDAMEMIAELGGIEKFRNELVRIHREIDSSYTVRMSAFGSRHEKAPYAQAFTEQYLSTASNLPPEETKRLLSIRFKDSPSDFWRGLSIAVGTKLPAEALELLGKFVYDAGKAVMQFPEYLYFWARFNMAGSTTEKFEYSEKMKSRLDDNLALGLLALLYDGTADLTWNLFKEDGKISADAQSDRYRELVHSIWPMNTWTPEGVKDVLIALAPFLSKLVRRSADTRAVAPKNPQTARYEAVALPEMGVPRERMKLRTAESSEFREISPEKTRAMAEELRSVIGDVRYDTIGQMADFFKTHEGFGWRQNMLETYAQLKIGQIPNLLEKWGNCVDMSLELRNRLEKKGVHSYPVRFEASNKENPVARQYSEVNHLALVVPRLWPNGQSFVLLDPWLLISKPIEFGLRETSRKMPTAGGKSVDVAPNAGENATTYPSLLRRYDKNGRIEKTIPFDPTKELANPFDVITKSLMRSSEDVKLVKQSPEGIALGHVKVDIKGQTITFQVGNAGWKTVKTFEEFESYVKTEEWGKRFAAAESVLAEKPNALLEKIRIIIRNSEEFKEKVMIPDKPRTDPSRK